MVGLIGVTGCTGGSSTPAPTGTPPATNVATAAPSDAPTSAATTSPNETSSAETPSGEQTIDELYQEALAEGGVLSYYGALAQVNAEIILPLFEERFPGITVDQVDATSTSLLTKAAAEMRGGATLGDVLVVTTDDLPEAIRLELLQSYLPPEAEEYADILKGDGYIATDEQYFVGAWNTELVSEADAPTGFEDFADPKYEALGGLAGEPVDFVMVAGFIHKYDGDTDKALDLLQRIADNNHPVFHSGHSNIAELLVAGQVAACFTCYTHHYPSRQADGAPVDFFITEGVGVSNVQGILKGAPHQKTAELWIRWVASKEGQEAFSQGGRTPVRPDVEPANPIRPENIYRFTAEDYTATLPDGRTYEEAWKEIFDIR